MAVIDIREATINLWGGTSPAKTLLTNLALTAIPKHLCSKKISITLVGPTTTEPDPVLLSVAVTDYDIVVTLASDAYVDATPGPEVFAAITTDLDAIVTLLNNDADAKLLVLAVCETGGSALATTVTKSYLIGQEKLSVKIGEGNLTYNEQSKVKFILDRGNLDTVKTENDEPVDVSFGFTWEFLTASSGGTETVEDVLKQRGEASDWVSSADDVCQPYCVDVELLNVPACVGIDNEQVLFEEFYYESLAHDLKAGTVESKGRCNRASVTITRGA